MTEKKCAVCGTDVPMRIAIGVTDGIGFYCEECDKYYCPKHFKVGETEHVCAGVDAEATRYYCPKGHCTQW